MENSKKTLIEKRSIVFWFALGFLTILVTIITILGCYLLSTYYLHKAKVQGNQLTRLRYYETSEMFWHSADASLSAADILYNNKDYNQSALYYASNESKAGFSGYVKAIYQLGKFSEVVETTGNHQVLMTAEAEKYLVYSELRLGRLADARKTIVKSATDSDIVKLEIALLVNIKDVGAVDADSARILEEDNTQNSYTLAYNELEKLGYPQAAISLLQEGYDGNNLSRDGLLMLAQREIDKSNYTKAESVLIRAAEKDQYYPQTYRQLVLVAQKLGDKESGLKYQQHLAAISF